MQTSSSSQRRSRSRSKESTFALVAGLFVLACFFVYSRRDASGFSRTTESSEQFPNKLPPSVDPSINTIAPPSHNADTTAADPGLIAAFPPSGSTTDYTSSSLAPAPAPATALSPSSPRAIIIESEIIPNLVPLMLHFATVLGPAWGVILFTLADGYVEPRSPAFQRHLAAGRIEVRFLPAATALTSSQAVSRFLTSTWLWEQVKDTPRVLMFQSDSVLCSKSEASVEEYFEYDYVGAPIAAQYGQGYNGGLSIRNPSVFLNVTRTVDFAASGQEFEDQFFFAELGKMGAAMPAEEVAKTFAVETIYYETPLGYHQPQRWQAEKMGEIEAWCPEVKMLIGRRAG